MSCFEKAQLLIQGVGILGLLGTLCVYYQQLRTKPFVENWGPSIRHCYEVTKPLIQEMQKPENSGPTYWDDFIWLYEQVPKASQGSSC